MPPAHRWVEMVAQVEALKVQVALLTATVNTLIPQVAAKMPSSPALPPLPAAPR